MKLKTVAYNRIKLLLTVLFIVQTIALRAVNGQLYTSSQMSGSLVTCIAQDEKGYMWIGTTNGLNRFDGYRFKTYTHDSDNPRSIIHNGVTKLHIDGGGRLWVGTVNGLSLYNADTDDFDNITISEDEANKPRITSFAEDDSGNLFVGTQGFGLYEIESGKQEATRYHLYSSQGNDDYYSCIFIDSKSRFWKVDNDGVVVCFSMEKRKPRMLLRQRLDIGTAMQFVEDNKGRVFVIGQSGIMRYDGKSLNKVLGDARKYVFNCAILSAKNEIVLGVNGGVRILAQDGSLKTMNVRNDEIDLSKINTTAIFEDHGHNLWIGCAERGLAFVPVGRSQFQNITMAQFDVKTSGVVTSLCNDNTANVYVTISGAGLYTMNVKSGDFTHIPTPNSTDYVYHDTHGRLWLAVGKQLYSYSPSTGGATLRATFDCIDLRSLCDDADGNLYISTFGKGLCVFDPSTGKQRIYSMFHKDDSRLGHLCNDWIMRVIYGSDSKIWIGTASGLQCFDPKTGSFKPYGWHVLMDGKAINALAEDASGNIVAGTSEGLFLYDNKTRKVGRFPASDELKNLKISSIVCLDNGDLWCSTSMGIWHYSKRQARFTSYVNGNGLTNHEYLEGVGMKNINGHIVFGTPEGVIAFDPSMVTTTRYTVYSPVLTEIIVSGKAINASMESDGRRIIDKAVSDADHITLSYIDNSFTLEFSSFDFANIDNSQLEYRLDRDNWVVNNEGVNAINFSHLQPGTYKLEVRTNNHGQRSQSRFYTITIRAPWYRTTVAYLLYICVLVVAGFVVFNVYKRRKRQEMDEEKMQFLINATHDIRTPLTLILNPLHQLMKQSETDSPQDMDKLQTINHNANRILTLVNQILDIRKMDKMQMHLHCRETSLAQLISDACKTFDYNAKKRGITFTFDHSEDVVAYVDRTQFDKVVTNLLSNAFKYTDDGGEITISLKNDASNAIIEVRDNGVGLKEGDAERIFKRFYQSGTATVVGQEGTGIGLNLCKMIIDMHHGTISAANREDKRGSVFRVTIPLGSAHLKAEDIVATEETKAPAKRPGTNYRVLLVDDDSEITDYISSELSNYYHFTVCRNGKQAIGELLSEKKYDLVVSDVMMPEMDGFTLLRLIKTNSNISHIPVILLTTEAAIGNRLEGLERGADAFLAKPFMLDELRATIDNLIANRQKLRGKFSGAQQQADKVEQQDVADNDKELMERIMKSVNKNIGDSDFSVEQLCQEVGVSRTQLHRKMKEMTGLSTAEFIRNIRLEQAARLLKERHVNVSQVAYTLGFVNLAHFSKVFKQHFGVPPSEYGKRDSVAGDVDAGQE